MQEAVPCVIVLYKLLHVGKEHIQKTGCMYNVMQKTNQGDLAHKLRMGYAADEFHIC